MVTRPTRRSRLVRWGTSGVLALLLVVAYVLLWRPIQSAIVTHVFFPVLASIDAGSSFVVKLAAAGRVVQVSALDPASDVALGIAAPAGVKFLLPALLLVVLLPYRAWWLPFLLGHLILSGLIVGAVGLGLSGVSAGFALARFAQQYLVDVYSLGVPALVWLHTRRESLATVHDKNERA